MRRAYSAGLAAVLLAVSLLGCGDSSSRNVSSVPGDRTEYDAAPAASESHSNAEPASADGASYAMPEPSSAKYAERRPEEHAPTQAAQSLVESERPSVFPAVVPEPHEGIGPGLGGDRFDHLVENGFVSVKDAPLSTFSIDVDTASYSKARMYLQQRNMLPPPDAVRIEELVNYFDYDYSPPAGDDPFAVHLEVARAPWQPQHLLARVGLKGREIDETRPAGNLVFLIDVSGSMNRPNKLGLVKHGLQMLTSQLQDDDRVSIVVYAGAAGLVLPPTRGDNRHVILDALARLSAGGSTNGGQGIRLAYQVAKENFIKGGINRVLLCTDGDFNVGTTSTGDLVRLAEGNAKEGVFLSVLGFGMGNHNDAMLEELSNKADGNYAFIDSDQEARKVLLDQLNSTLVTIAKDVKIQIEFNPVHVASYRLIGYENRRLADRDFNDDKKDAGEIGAGHTVTALYELVPAGADEATAEPNVDPLKYQQGRTLSAAADSDDLLNLKLRFKRPHNDRSELVVFPVKNTPLEFGQATKDFQFAAAVAEFGMLLRNSKYRGDASYAEVLEIAESSRGPDGHGYRSEFLQVVNIARRLVEPDAAAALTSPELFCGTLPATSTASYHLPLLNRPVTRWSIGVFLVVAAASWLVIAVLGCIVIAWALTARNRRPVWHGKTIAKAKLSRATGV